MEETSREIIKTSSEKNVLEHAFPMGAKVSSQRVRNLRYYMIKVSGPAKLSPT